MLLPCVHSHSFRRVAVAVGPVSFSQYRGRRGSGVSSCAITRKNAKTCLDLETKYKRDFRFVSARLIFIGVRNAARVGET